MKKRIFVGIKASNNLQSVIDNWRQQYEHQLDVRWIEAENLHITLVPPWWEVNIKTVKEKLDSFEVKTQPFGISFDRVTFGPKPKQQRLVWIEGESENIVQLKKEVEKALNIQSEKRPHKTHLTIARFKPRDFKKFSMKKLDEKVNWKEDVSTFSLFESKLHPTGAQYKILAEYMLLTRFR